MDFMQFIQNIINEKMTLNSLSKNIGSTLGDINIKDFNLMLKRPYSKSKLHDNFINLRAYIESHIEDDIINAYKEGVYNKTLRIREDVVKENFKKYNKDEEYNNVHGYSTFIGFILSEIEEGDYLNAGRRILQYMIWVYGEEIIKKKLIQLTKDYLNGVIDSDDEEYDEGFEESVTHQSLYQNSLREKKTSGIYELEIRAVEVVANPKSFRSLHCSTDACGETEIEIYFESKIIPKEYKVYFLNKENPYLLYNSRNSSIPNIVINGNLSSVIKVPPACLSKEIYTKTKELIATYNTDDSFENLQKFIDTKFELDSLLKSCEQLKKYIDNSIFYINKTFNINYFKDRITIGQGDTDLETQLDISVMISKDSNIPQPIRLTAHGGEAHIITHNSDAIRAINTIIEKDSMSDVDVDLDDEEYDEGFDESLSRNNHLRENEEEEPYFYTLEIGDIEVNSSLQSLKEKEIKDDYIEVYFDSTIVPKEYPCKFRGEDSSITYNSTRIPNILINGDLSAIIRIPFTHLPEEVETKAKEFIKISTEDDKFEHIKEWDATLTELNSLLRSCDYIKKYIDDSLFFIRNTLPVSTDTLTLGEDYADLNAKFKVVYMMKKFVEYSHPIEFVQGVFANIEVTNSKAILAMNNIIKEEITRDTSVDSDDEEYDEGFEESLIKHKRRLRY